MENDSEDSSNSDDIIRAGEVNFEEEVRRHEFSELVRLALVVTEALFRLVGRRSFDRPQVAPTIPPPLDSGKADLAIAVTAMLTMVLLGAGNADAGNPRLQQEGTDSDIPVVLHVVSCASDLLDCRDVQTPDSTFHRMEACHVYWAEARPGTMISETAGRIIFARCRYSPMATRNAPVLRNVARRQMSWIEHPVIGYAR